MILEISIDWARDKHDYAYAPAGNEDLHEGTVRADPKDLREWLLGLREAYPQHQFHVILEMSRGPLVTLLMEFDFIVLYPLNPLSAKSFRRAFRPSGAKDDTSDAWLWLEYLRKHKSSLRPLRPISAQARQLEQLTRNRRKLIDQRTSLVQQVQATALEYYPQFLKLVGNLYGPVASAFFKRWPDLQSLKNSREETIRKFYYVQGVRKPETLEKRLKLIREAEPTTSEESAIAAWRLLMDGLLSTIRALSKSIDQHEELIEEVFAACDFEKRQIALSLPRAGKALAPRMWMAMNYVGQLEDAQEACAFSGVAPVRVQSGKSCAILRRKSKPHFLHQSLIEFANQSRFGSSWASTYYKKRREEGCAHWAVLRALAAKWVRILYACWQNNTPYDEEAYVQILRRRNSPYAPPKPA